MTATTASSLVIAGTEILPGTTHKLELACTKLYTDTTIGIPVFVKRGKRPGPILFLSAAIHGDELNGVEIINRVIHSKRLTNLRGTLIAVPVVNVYGVISQSRYLPDRRDLNRSFPGSPRGSLAARLAHTFLEEIVKQSDYGIDFHTGAIHRTNLPQIRANLDDQETSELAHAFGVPVLLNANLRDGSLRQCAADMGTRILLYEAGEALRFDLDIVNAQYAQLLNRTKPQPKLIEDSRQPIQQKIRSMSMYLNQVRNKAATVAKLQQDDFWEEGSIEALEEARQDIRSVIHLRDKTVNPLPADVLSLIHI